MCVACVLFSILIIVIIYFWWKNFLEEDHSCFFFLSFFEFNFRPSVGAWLPATDAKQRLVYANGQGRDAVTALSLALPLSLNGHINSDSLTILNKDIHISLYKRGGGHSNCQSHVALAISTVLHCNNNVYFHYLLLLFYNSQ